MSSLSASEVRRLDPYAFLAVLGKRVIHPGGRASTDRLLELAALRPGERVLDIGCGVATTAVRLARECDVDVVAADISMLMRERATRNVRAAHLEGRSASRTRTSCPCRTTTTPSTVSWRRP